MGQQPPPESEQQHEDIKMNLLLTDTLHKAHSQNEGGKTMHIDIWQWTKRVGVSFFESFSIKRKKLWTRWAS